MPDTGTVTVWLHRLQAGEHDDAVERLWRTYFARLVALARRHLGARPRAVMDEEDVALSAFDSFIRAVDAGRFPELRNRDDLWQVLFVVAARKAADVRAYDGRQKRGGGAATTSLSGEDGAAVPVPATGPTPAEAVVFTDQVAVLLDALGDPELRQIALGKLDGETNEELAARLGRSLPTVERKLRRIRDLWQEYGTTE